MFSRLSALPLTVVAMILAAGCLGEGPYSLQAVELFVTVHEPQDNARVEAAFLAMGFEPVESSDRGVRTAPRDGVFLETTQRGPGEPWRFRAYFAASGSAETSDEVKALGAAVMEQVRPQFEALLADFETRTSYQHVNDTFDWRARFTVA